MGSIVDFTGSPTYEWARHLATTLKITYVYNLATFCDHVKRITIDVTEVSYDFTSLYTKDPIQQALEVIQKRLLVEIINR